MPYRIELINGAPTPTAVIRDHVKPEDLARFVPAACGEVWSFVRAQGLPKPGRHVALYRPGHEVEVGVEVGAPFTGNDRVVCSELPSGPVATAAHFGPYQGLSEAHAAIREWCASRGHTLAGFSWEIYGHWDESWNSDPSKIRTDVFRLLKT